MSTLTSPAAPTAAPAHDDLEIVITRLIDAPRSLVFGAWIDGKQMAKWWGPHTYTNPVCEIDARPGGALRIHMQSPEGAIYPTRGVVQEVVENQRLVYTMEPETGTSAGAIWDSFPAPPAATHIISFEDQDGKTKLTSRTRLATAADREAMVKMGFIEGFTHGLERLEILVENQ